MIIASVETRVAKKRPSRVIVLSCLGVMIVACMFFASERISAERHPLTSPPAKVDPRLGIASGRLATKFQVDALVFSGDKFPIIGLERPALIEQKFGDCEISTLFFDREGQVVATPGRPGPYGAVIVIKPKRQRPSRRYLTLFRTVSPLALDGKFNPADPSHFAEVIGVSARVITRHSEILTKKFRDRPYSQLIHDPTFTRILAGLSLAKDLPTPAQSWNDAEAAELRWWLNWKRKSLGPAASRIPKFEIPKPVFGSPARTIQEGTFEDAGMKPGSDVTIDAVLQDWVADSDQAFAVCIVRKGILVFHRAYGTRDGEPMTIHTKSWMASITKPMSASLMMMLVDEGLVSLDDRIADLLPQLKGLTTDRPVTIRHLYTHTHNLDFWLKGQDELPDFEDRVADCYPSAHAGRIWIYNGVGYTLGGKIIENLTAETIPEFYRKHLLEPLGMDQTDVSGTHADARSVPLDIAKFGQMLLNGGAYGDNRFFRPATFRNMLPQRLTAVLGPDSKKVWGIGFDDNMLKLGHGAASSAIFRVDREAELVVVMTRDKRGKNFEKYEPLFWEAIYAGIK